MFALWDGPVRTWGWVDFLIAVIIVAGCVGIAYILIVEVFKIQFPPWLVKIFWIVVSCFVGVFAIRLIANM